MLQIRLRRDPKAETGGGARPSSAETVTVACPDHLVLADLPVAKGIGYVSATSVVETVGRRSRRNLGERVRFCVRCDFPIAVYGRLNPCEHAFCLECARSDSICYICDERIQKIQTIKMMEGIFICAAPRCLKSFLNMTEFESHIHAVHADLLQPNAEKDDGNESDVQSTKQSSASEYTHQRPSQLVFGPSSNTHSLEQQLPRSMTEPNSLQPASGQATDHPVESKADNSRPSPGFDRPKQTFQHEFNPGNLSTARFPEYPPIQSLQTSNFSMPMNQNPVLHLPFGFPPPCPTNGTQPFYGTPYGMPRAEGGSEQGSLLSFPPGPTAIVKFSGTYPQTWNPGLVRVPFEATQGVLQAENRDRFGGNQH